MAAALDAEGSDRYLFDEDYKPSIDYAIEWMTTALNDAFSLKKVSAEYLVDLLKVRVFQTSDFSRLKFDPAQMNGDIVWSILAIHPEAKCYPTNSVIPSQPYESIVRNDIVFLSSDYSAKRLTFEQWQQNKQNVFLPGNEVLKTSFKEYAYLDYAKYETLSQQYTVSFPEIEIRPSVKQQLVGVRYLKKPTLPTTINDTVEFPESMTNMIVEKALNWISYKQGDNTTLYLVTERDLQKLVSTLSR
jgi:hypothetical protein